MADRLTHSLTHISVGFKRTPTTMPGLRSPRCPDHTHRGGRGEGCQIDLLVQTESSAYVVEIKRRREIPASIVDEVQAKIDRLPLRRGLSVRTALVYDGELAPPVVRRRLDGATGSAGGSRPVTARRPITAETPSVGTANRIRA